MKNLFNNLNELLFNYFSNPDFQKPGYSNEFDVMTLYDTDIRIYMTGGYCIELWKTFDEDTGLYNYNYSDNIFQGFNRISNIELAKKLGIY